MTVHITVRVRKDGRVTVPKAVREALSLGVGDLVRFPIHEDGTVAVRKSS
ncbi:AbrB/MazE/SpoVT family DNA-binding domain-containing protein [Glycomyces xiaoerkulensis]|nr:AbrB/MazE/SpoVT family DNA-binding domain-containing protein [Glycomyces xiaoerkulensis]